MGLNIAIIEFDKENKPQRVDFFTNNNKGIGDFLIQLNEELKRNNYNIRIKKVER